MNTITATYCTNYNGLTLADEEGDMEDHPNKDIEQKASLCSGEIVDALHDECDDDGEFQGDEEEAAEFITKTVHKFFPDVNVVVKFDNFSS